VRADLRVRQHVVSLRRYLRLYVHFARTSLIREMSFRLHFLLRCLIHVVWIGLYVAFFDVLFRHVQRIGDWDKYPYLLFQGTYLLLNSVVNGLFLNNAAELAERIRTGDLDHALTKPVDEQFLLTCQRVDWALLPQVVLGAVLVVTAAANLEEPWTLLDGLAYVLLLAAGVAVLYGAVVVLASAGFWLVSREGLFDLWFALMEMVRIPSDLFEGNALLLSLRFVLFCGFPVFVAVNVPARFGARLLGDPWPVGCLCLGAVGWLVVGRRLFRRGLSSYRSASS
jgi:ABC-2 type transport system permease protein